MKIFKKTAVLAAVFLAASLFAGCSVATGLSNIVKDDTIEKAKDTIQDFNSTLSDLGTLAEEAIGGIVHSIADKADESLHQDSAAGYHFRNEQLLEQHYQKHGIEMGFSSAEEYERAASAVITNPESLCKEESEDDDLCYYLEATNEFVVLSSYGYIRTYFCPDAGKEYFDRQ